MKKIIRSPIGCPSWRFVHHQIDQTKYPCSLSSVKRSLKRSGYISRKMRKVPHLTPQQKFDRLELANRLERFTPFQYARILWTDEKIFKCGYHSRNIWYICKRSDEPLEVPKDVEKYFGGKGVHIWMAVSLEWGVPKVHCFHEFEENETVTNETFLSELFIIVFVTNRKIPHNNIFVSPAHISFCIYY